MPGGPIGDEEPPAIQTRGIAAVCFPQGLMGPRGWDQRVHVHSTHIARWLLHSGGEGGCGFCRWSGRRRPRGCWTPEALVQYCGLPWSPPHRSEFKRPPRRQGVSTVGTILL
jgi:hypothetical protein